MTTGPQDLANWWSFEWGKWTPPVIVAVAIEAADGDEFVYCAVEAKPDGQKWIGVISAPTVDVAFLDVFCAVRAAVGPADRIAFRVAPPDGSRLWRHWEELRAAFPRCTFQGPGPHDVEAMSAAVEGLPPVANSARDPRRAGYSLEPLTVATDGSVRGKYTGYAWLASDGRYGLEGKVHPRSLVGPERVLISELRAIDDAVRTLTDRRLTVLCDCQGAIAMAQRWMNGEEILPKGYTTERKLGRTAGLLVARKRIRRQRDRLSFQWVPGHKGEPLNEGADALARLASRRVRGHSGLNAAEYRKRAEGLAEGFAAAFAVRAN